MYIESKTIELKQELTKNIKKEIVAFANSLCKTLFTTTLYKNIKKLKHNKTVSKYN